MEMLEFTTNMAKHQQDAMAAMMEQMSQTRSKPANRLDDRHYKIMGTFIGDGSWKD